MPPSLACRMLALINAPRHTAVHLRRMSVGATLTRGWTYALSSAEHRTSTPGVRVWSRNLLYRYGLCPKPPTRSMACLRQYKQTTPHVCTYLWSHSFVLPRLLNLVLDESSDWIYGNVKDFSNMMPGHMLVFHLCSTPVLSYF